MQQHSPGKAFRPMSSLVKGARLPAEGISLYEDSKSSVAHQQQKRDSLDSSFYGTEEYKANGIDQNRTANEDGERVAYDTAFSHPGRSFLAACLECEDARLLAKVFITSSLT